VFDACKLTAAAKHETHTKHRHTQNADMHKMQTCTKHSALEMQPCI